MWGGRPTAVGIGMIRSAAPSFWVRSTMGVVAEETHGPILAYGVNARGRGC